MDTLEIQYAQYRQKNQDTVDWTEQEKQDVETHISPLDKIHQESQSRHLMLIKIAQLVWTDYKLVAVCATVIHFITGILEGVSILALVPLLQTWTDQNERGFVANIFNDIFSFLHVEMNALNCFALITSLILLKSLFTICNKVLIGMIQINIEVDKKNSLYGTTLTTQLHYLYHYNFGKLSNALIHETRKIGMLVDYLSRLLISTINIAIYTIVAFSLFQMLTVIFAAIAAAYYFVVRRIFLRAQELGRDVTMYNSHIQETVNYTLSGYRIIKSFVRENIFKSRLNTVLKKYRATNIKLVGYESLLNSIFEPLTMIMVTVVYFIFPFEMTIFIPFIFAAYRMYGAFQGMQNMHFKLAQHVASLEVFSSATEQFLENQYPNERQGLKFSGLKHEIALRQVTHTYKTDNSVFKLGPLDILVPKGQTIGLVGHSGSGKSTTMDLLEGFLMPDDGVIMLDGHPLRDYDMISVRARIGYVAQDMFFLNDTVTQNILLSDHTIPEEQVKTACQLANAKDFIDDLPDKYSTMLGEQGTRLSGGQKQRIALARALVHQPDILILDEATSALDNVSEQQIQEAIDSLSGDMTIIVVAHRLSTVKTADNIYVFDNGKIVEEGTFDELLNKKGHFYQMHATT